jgi:two-component system, LytTR family, sensor kinase
MAGWFRQAAAGPARHETIDGAGRFRYDGDVTRNSWLPSRAVAAALGLLYTAIGLLLFSYRYLEDLANRRMGTLVPRFIDEMTGVYTALAAIPIIFWTTRRFPITRQTWKTAVPIAIAGAIVYSAVHTTLMWLARLVLYPAAGFGPYDYGNMLFRYPMEASNDLISYATISGFIYFFDRMAAARKAELAASELQTKLAEAQLENLRLQLNPHFLFNTLNAISSVMYEDLAKADEMLSKLSDFLRVVLASNGVHQVPLGEEIDVERKYVEIMTARLEQRLGLRVTVGDDAETATVPFMILQPLLENSIRHGTPAGRGAIDIEIDVARKNGSTVISVSDDGSGFAPAGRGGHGLELVRSRLAHMYGDAASFTIASRDGGGTQAVLTFPYAPGAGSER